MAHLPHLAECASDKFCGDQRMSVVQPITPWMPDDTADFQSNSSVGSDSSPISQLADRTGSTGLAEATMLGSSPDEASQPVFTARQASGALSTLGMFIESPEGDLLPIAAQRVTLWIVY